MAARFLLFLLADNMWASVGSGDDRYCAFPGLTKLATEMGCSKNTTRKAIRLLEQEGLLSIERGGGKKRLVKGRAVRTHVYRLGPTTMAFIERQWPVTGAGPTLRAVGQ